MTRGPMHATDFATILRMCPECINQDSTSPKHSGILQERQQTANGCLVFRCKNCRVYWAWRFKPAGWCKPYYEEVPGVVVDDDTERPDDLIDSSWAPS